MSEQSYKNHRRYHAPYHYLLTLLILISFGGSLYLVYRSMMRGSDRIVSVLILLLVVMAFVEGSLLRIYALKAQDRAIRAEENLRHYAMTGSLLDPRLDVRQIVGLRFASDEEFAELARRAAEEGLSEDDIKKAVENWRGDDYRV
jgi:hypothetical protein